MGVIRRNALVLVTVSTSLLSGSAALAIKAVPQWEPMVKQGNLEFQRGRYSAALHQYRAALAILQKRSAYDLRLAVVMKDIARVYKADIKHEAARIWDAKAAMLYKQEIEQRQLGGEYSRSETADLWGQRLRPACPLCHENFRVIPVHIGPGTGYDGPVPDESDPKFVVKPATSDILEERWYCKGCKQPF